jgi:thiol:disulfide interchange protein DsbD
MKADWTNYNPKITTLLEKHNRGGVPLYLLYPKDSDKPPLILPQILTPQQFSSDIKDFLI